MLLFLTFAITNHPVLTMPQLSIIIACYLLIVNLLAFALYGIDKRKAQKKKFRIPERTLLWMARIGGGVGSWIGIMLFHHKTKHAKFRIVVPLWTVIWLVGIICLFDFGYL